MALQLRHWVSLVVLGCAAIAAAYLPPNKETGIHVIHSQSTDNPARVAQRQLSRQIRQLRERRDLALLRDEVLSALNGEETKANGPAVFATADVPEQMRTQVQQALDTQWIKLGTPTQIDVAMFLRLTPGKPLDLLAPSPPRNIDVVTLLPQTTDGETCIRIATINASHLMRTQMLLTDFQSYSADYFLTTGLGVGPCGFYAAFGKPGETVATWLEEAGYRFSLVPNWDGLDAITPNVARLREAAQDRDLYGFSPVAFACATGKEHACAEIVHGRGGRITRLTPKTVGYGRIKETYVGPRSLSRTGWNLGGREMFMLSELVAQFGHESFQEFWKTSRPLDVAFSELTGAQPADWTRQWVQRQFGVLRAGPSVGLGFAAFALLVSGISMGLGMFLTARRQY